MVEEVSGNILLSKENIIGHQVNCRFVMGAGLAKQIRDKYPVVYDEYMKAKNQRDVLGKTQLVYVGKHKVVANLFGQYNYGRYGLYTDYIALEEALAMTRKFAQENNYSVALPHGLGCGLAGGNWNIVRSIIERVFDGYKVTIYKY